LLSEVELVNSFLKMDDLGIEARLVEVAFFAICPN
jgi:hypothetical protein